MCEDPDGREVPVSLKWSNTNIVHGEWQALKEGTHKVCLELDGHPVCGSPLPTSVLDLSTVRVVGLRNDVVGATQTFNCERTSIFNFSCLHGNL